MIPVFRHDDVVAHAIIDPSDFDWLNEWPWRLNGDGYADRHIGKATKVLMHREILGLEQGDGIQGDHVNRDRLDNRRSNLRRADYVINGQNQTGRGASKYRGVSPTPRANGARRWVAQVRVEGRLRHLGTFDTEAEAAAAALTARQTFLPYATN